MSESPTPDLTRLLADVRCGGPGAFERLVGILYEELRKLAGGMMSRERHSHTLQPTALVNEALIRMLGNDDLKTIEDRRHFYNAAATAMRHVLVDYARARAAARRGGAAERVPLDDMIAAYEENGFDFLAYDKAIDAMTEMDERQREFVRLRHLCGRPDKEIAEMYGLTVERVRQVRIDAETLLSQQFQKE